MTISIFCSNSGVIYVEKLTVNDSVPDFCGSPLGAMEISVFWPKIGTVQRSGLPLGSIIGGTSAHRHNFFPTGEIPVTREIDDIRQNFGIFTGEMG